MASIWSAAAATPTAAHRLPADVSAAGVPTYYSVEQLANLYISTGVTANAIGSVTGATAISLAAGGVVTATVTGNTTFSITNPPTAASEWVLILTNGGAHTITWFTTTWAGGTAPTLTASGVDVIHFATPNGGTTWYGWHETDFAVGTTAGTVAAGDDSRLTDDRTASGLRTASTVVAVSSATAPSSGQVLTATSSTAATWQTPNGGSSNTKWIGAGELIPRVTNGAGIDGEELATNDINLDYLAFDSATSEGAQVSFAWPGAYTTFTAQFHWTAASGSGTVTWTAAARCYADDDALDQAQGTAQSVTDTLLAANDAHKSSATSAVTPGGTVASGNLTVAQFTRDIADTLAVDARLIGVMLEFA